MHNIITHYHENVLFYINVLNKPQLRVLCNLVLSYDSNWSRSQGIPMEHFMAQNINYILVARMRTLLLCSTSLVDLTKNQNEERDGRLRKTSKSRTKRLSSERIAELFAVGLTYSKHV